MLLRAKAPALTKGGRHYESMERDPIGRITTMNKYSGNCVRTYTFTYTTAGRLEAVDRGTVHLQRHDQDSNGKRTAYRGG